MGHYLPSKAVGHLQRLNLIYDRVKKHQLRDLISAARIAVIEETSYDNWNGGTYAHDVVLFLPLEHLGRIDIDEQQPITREIRDDLNKLAEGVDNEGYNAVRLEMNDESDPLFQKAVPFSRRETIKPEAVSFWEPGLVRLFVSHRDQHKVAANRLAEQLESYGISCFVAHDTIEPTAEWRREIMKGLETMEAMLVFLTDDFDGSTWTNQEVGFALGKGVPIISLKLEKKDPPGFISHEQALRGHIDHPNEAAQGLYPLIAKAIGRTERLQQALINSFLSAPNFTETISRFETVARAVNTLAPEQVKAIKEGFYKNDQLHHSIYLTNKALRLVSFLSKATGGEFVIEGRNIIENPRAAPSPPDDDIPF